MIYVSLRQTICPLQILAKKYVGANLRVTFSADLAQKLFCRICFCLQFLCLKACPGCSVIHLLGRISLPLPCATCRHHQKLPSGFALPPDNDGFALKAAAHCATVEALTPLPVGSYEIWVLGGEGMFPTVRGAQEGGGGRGWGGGKQGRHYTKT